MGGQHCGPLWRCCRGPHSHSSALYCQNHRNTTAQGVPSLEHIRMSPATKHIGMNIIIIIYKTYKAPVSTMCPNGALHKSKLSVVILRDCLTITIWFRQMSFEFVFEFLLSISLSYFYWDVIPEPGECMTKSSPSIMNHVKIRDR